MPAREARKTQKPLHSAPAGQSSHGGTGTRRKVLARNADVLVGISNSLRELYGNSAKPSALKCGANSCAFGIQKHRSRQDTGMDLKEPWIAALELFNVGKN
jgi:hypothetical protein